MSRPVENAALEPKISNEKILVLKNKFDTHSRKAENNSWVALVFPNTYKFCTEYNPYPSPQETEIIPGLFSIHKVAAEYHTITLIYYLVTSRRQNDHSHSARVLSGNSQIKNVLEMGLFSNEFSDGAQQFNEFSLRGYELVPEFVEAINADSVE